MMTVVQTNGWVETDGGRRDGWPAGSGAGAGGGVREVYVAGLPSRAGTYRGGSVACLYAALSALTAALREGALLCSNFIRDDAEAERSRITWPGAAPVWQGGASSLGCVTQAQGVLVAARSDPRPSVGLPGAGEVCRWSPRCAGPRGRYPTLAETPPSV